MALLRSIMQRLLRGPVRPVEAPKPTPAIGRREAELEALCKVLMEFEGLRLKPYLCSGGKWTIGYGATYTLGNRPVTAKTKPMTETAAYRLLQRDAAKRYDRIVKALRPDATSGARIAFSSLAFNMGAGRIIKSDAMEEYNNRRIHEAGVEFKEWRKAGGKIMPGLERRRKKEWALVLECGG